MLIQNKESFSHDQKVEARFPKDISSLEKNEQINTIRLIITTLFQRFLLRRYFTGNPHVKRRRKDLISYTSLSISIDVLPVLLQFLPSCLNNTQLRLRHFISQRFRKKCSKSIEQMSFSCNEFEGNRSFVDEHFQINVNKREKKVSLFFVGMVED